jgi:MFS family permease
MRGNAFVMSITEPIGQGVLFLTSPFWSLYVLDLGASMTLLGLLGLISGLIRVLLQAPVGYLTDRMGRKNLIVWGGFISSFAPFTYLFATSWEHLIPGVVLEAFTNIVLPARQAMFADSIDPDRRATAFAAIHTLFAIPRSVMPVMSGYLLEKVGFLPGMRTALLVSGIVMLLTTLGRARYLREDLIIERKSAEKFSFRSAIHDMFEPVITLKALRVAVLGAFLYSLAVGVLMRYSVVYAVDVIGLSEAQWGLVAGGMGAVGIFTRIPMGWMIDRFSRKLCIFISYATRPVFILAFALSTNFPQVLLIQMADNVFSYMQQPALEALAIDIASKRRRGRTYGALNMVPGIALTIAPMMGAVIWEVFGAAWAFYSSAFFTAAAAVILLAFLHEPEKKED